MRNKEKNGKMGPEIYLIISRKGSILNITNISQRFLVHPQNISWYLTGYIISKRRNKKHSLNYTYDLLEMR